MTKSRIATIGLSAALVFGAVAPATAVTVAELQAQINALMAQLTALQGGSSTASASFTKDLTVGSTGSEVSALQNVLVSGGYLVMPAGASMGYFGSLTKAAVMKWQAAVGLPSTGFVGSMSRAKLNASGASTGSTGTTGTVSGSISTPGAEGTLTVTSAPVSSSTVYVGDMKDVVLAFDAKATNSDILVQRAKIDLGTSANIYNKVFNKIYLLSSDGSVIASSDLNSSTVVKDSDSRYYITLSGFSSLVKKGETRNYKVAVDLMPSVDSAYRTSYTIRFAASGVRAVDGAGVSLYSPANATDISKSVTVAASLVDSANMSVSLNSSSPLAREVVAADGSSNDEADKVVVLVFDIRAEKSDVKITDLINFVVTKTDAGTASGATASTTYLYEGNGTTGTLLGSASVSTSDADFTNISTTVAKGTTKTYTLAVDVRGADAAKATFAASFTGNSTNVVGESANGTTVTTVSGSATGNNVIVRNVGPVFTLTSAPTITYTAAAGVSGATSTAKATFKLNIKAVGSDVEFGNGASTTYPLAGWGSAASAASTVIYQNGSSATPSVASSTSMTIPSSGLVTAGTNSRKIAKGNSVDVTVDYIFEGRTSAGALITTASYAVGLERLNWLTNTTGRQSSTFMSGDTNWRTGTVTMP